MVIANIAEFKEKELFSSFNHSYSQIITVSMMKYFLCNHKYTASHYINISYPSISIFRLGYCLCSIQWGWHIYHMELVHQQR